MIIQAAGVKNKAELELLIEAGFTDIGFPLRLPVNQADTSESEAKDLIILIPKNINKVLISYIDNAKELIELSDYLGTNIIQIHGEINLAELKKIKTSRPKLKIIKSLVIKEGNFLELEKTIYSLEKYVGFFITDTYDPHTGASGATGKTHDWNISKAIVSLSSKPVILAGGLNPSNVRNAISFVKPAGVDVHTGIENSFGDKDKYLAKNFVIETKKI